MKKGLERGTTFKEIASIISKDPTTVSKEIKRNKIVKKADSHSVHKDAQRTIKETPRCPLLVRAPYVCNGCKKNRHKCGYNKEFYYAKNAQIKYEETLVESRSGIAL